MEIIGHSARLEIIGPYLWTVDLRNCLTVSSDAEERTCFLTLSMLSKKTVMLGEKYDVWKEPLGHSMRQRRINVFSRPR